MPAKKPPPRLPRGFRGVWRALHDADRLASRAELARRLGVSTHTLQRILVDGDVPDFSRPQSTRLVRSWARSLTRMAHALGADARGWIERTGIVWDEGVRAASESVREQLREPRSSGFAASGRTAGPLERIRAEAAGGRPDPVEAGFVDLRPFSDRLPDAGESFLEAYARRLVGAVDPRWGIRATQGAAADLVDALAGDEPSLHLAVGIFETAHLRGRGIAFLPIPGWQLGFSAVWAVGEETRAEAPSWAELSSPPAGAKLRWVVSEADPAWSLVRSQWGARPDRIQTCRRASPEELARDLEREARRRPEEPVVLVADEESCRRVLDRLERGDGSRRGIAVAAVRPTVEERPRFQLAVAVRADSSRWPELLEFARREELFGASRVVTARLYADLLAVAARSLAALERSGAADLPTNLRPEPFAEADAEFRRALCRRLVSSLRAAPDRVGSSAARRPDDDEAWDAIVRLGRALLPREWRTTFDEAAWLAKRGEHDAMPEEPRPFHSYCQSCSGSLREYPGPSPLYCRWCSDEEGRLRSRDEVLELIAEWMRAWQGGITREEARERAERYMSAMPAWSGS